MDTKAYFMVNPDKEQMVTKAHFILNVTDTIAMTEYPGILKDLETIPEVKSVERMRGTWDLRVEIETPLRIIFVANKLMALDWVKQLYVLKVEPFQPREYEGLNAEELLKLKKAIAF